MVCELCGDIGAVNALIYCFKCQVSMRHCYCLDVLSEKLDSDSIMWACEDCQDVPRLRHGSSTTTNEPQIQVPQIDSKKKKQPQQPTDAKEPKMELCHNDVGEHHTGPSDAQGPQLEEPQKWVVEQPLQQDDREQEEEKEGEEEAGGKQRDKEGEKDDEEDGNGEREEEEGSDEQRDTEEEMESEEHSEKAKETDEEYNPEDDEEVDEVIVGKATLASCTKLIIRKTGRSRASSRKAKQPKQDDELAIMSTKGSTKTSQRKRKALPSYAKNRIKRQKAKRYKSPRKDQTMTRNSPTLLTDAIEHIRKNTVQKEWIEKTGFGELLKFDLKQNQHKLGYLLLNAYNSSSNAIQVGDGVLCIYEADVESIMGFPRGQKPLKINIPGSKEESKREKNWRDQYKGSSSRKRITGKEVQEKILQTKECNELFKMNFLVLMHNVLIRSQTNQLMKEDIIHFEGDLDKCAEYNWCSYLITHLKESKQVWTKGAQFYTGPLLFLTLLYVDRVIATYGPVVVRSSPAFEKWTDEKLKERARNEIKNKAFGTGNIRPRFGENGDALNVEDNENNQQRQEDGQNEYNQVPISVPLAVMRDPSGLCDKARATLHGGIPVEGLMQPHLDYSQFGRTSLMGPSNFDNGARQFRGSSAGGRASSSRAGEQPQCDHCMGHPPLPPNDYAYDLPDGSDGYRSIPVDDIPLEYQLPEDVTVVDRRVYEHLARQNMGLRRAIRALERTVNAQWTKASYHRLPKC